MFGYVNKFYIKVDKLFEDMRAISSRVSDNELEFAKRYFVKKHSVIGEDEDVCKFIKWYVQQKNYDIVHYNYINELRDYIKNGGNNGKN